MSYGAIHHVVKDINTFSKLMKEKLPLYIYRCTKRKNVHLTLLL